MDILKSQRNEELIQKLRDGIITKEEQDELINNYKVMALGVTKKYARSYNFDTMLADATFAVVIAVNKAKGRLKHNNFSPYCFLYIKGFLLRQMKQAQMIEYTNDMEKVLVNGDVEYVDTLDSILSKVEDMTELEVVKMRLQGYKDNEIAENLDISVSNVQRSRLKLESRVC